MHKLPRFAGRFEALLALACLLAAPTLAAGRMFCCTNAAGQQECGDTLPKACYARAYREIGESGLTQRNVEAPLTPEQRVQRAADEARARAEADARKEKLRKENLVLDTYGSEKDIEDARLRARTEVLRLIKLAQDQITQIRVKRKKMEDETKFYKNKKYPVELQQGLDDTSAEIKYQEAVIDAKNKELEAIRVKYDAERQRYIEASANRAAANR